MIVKLTGFLLLYFCFYNAISQTTVNTLQENELDRNLQLACKYIKKPSFNDYEWEKLLLKYPDSTELLILDIWIRDSFEKEVMHKVSLFNDITVDNYYQLSNSSMRKSISYFRLKDFSMGIESAKKYQETLNMLLKYKKFNSQVQEHIKNYNSIVMDNLISDALKHNNNFSSLIRLIPENLFSNDEIYNIIIVKLLDNERYFEAIKLSIEILNYVKNKKTAVAFWYNAVDEILGDLYMNISWQPPKGKSSRRENILEYVMRYNDQDDFIRFAQNPNNIINYSTFSVEEDRAEIFGAFVRCNTLKDNCELTKTIRARMKEHNIELILKYYFNLRFHYKWPLYCLSDMPLRVEVQQYLNNYERTVPKAYQNKNSVEILKGFLMAYKYMKQNGCKPLPKSNK
ncbi:hypothetical protein GO755_34985 [Spirosoma sp. HMF4905]|uniref:Uncharacterized protein n=1 Tax=Spirosoma arboris TaxID=2682092 RepID=A0A7K1SNA5_9BACT|nr:hypothetical protein [Spirosoma arboris]MVM35280.1 hypothetical protein [Spirosoma arboris]